MTKEKTKVVVERVTTKGEHMLLFMNNKGEAREYNAKTNPVLINSSFKEGCQPTDAQALFNALQACIISANPDLEEFKKLLNRKFFYKGATSAQRTPKTFDQARAEEKAEEQEFDSDSDDEDREEKNDRRTSPVNPVSGELDLYNIEETYYTRPVLEALFVERMPLFQQLVNALEKMTGNNKDKFQQVFVERMNNIPSFNETPMLWSEWDLAKLDGQAAALTQYRDKLPRAGAREKITILSDLASDLKTERDCRQATITHSSGNEACIRNLNAKLVMLNKLHDAHANPVIAKHRDPLFGRIVAEFFAALFGLALLGAVHLRKWYKTGSPLFFTDRTGSQETIAKVGANMLGNIDREVKDAQPEEKLPERNEYKRP